MPNTSSVIYGTPSKTASQHTNLNLDFEVCFTIAKDSRVLDKKYSEFIWDFLTVALLQSLLVQAE